MLYKPALTHYTQLVTQDLSRPICFCFTSTAYACIYASVAL